MDRVNVSQSELSIVKCWPGTLHGRGIICFCCQSRDMLWANDNSAISKRNSLKNNLYLFLLTFRHRLKPSSKWSV